MTAEMDLILEKLNNIEKTGGETLVIAKGNDRALRGYNNTPGLVSDMKQIQNDVTAIKETQPICRANFDEIEITLHGKGHESIGLVGETVMMKRIAKWILGISTGLIASTIALLIKLALTTQ